MTDATMNIEQCDTITIVVNDDDDITFDAAPKALAARTHPAEHYR